MLKKKGKICCAGRGFAGIFVCCDEASRDEVVMKIENRSSGFDALFIPFETTQVCYVC